MSTRSILVVEPGYTLRCLLEYRLSRHYHVEVAANGLEGLEKAEASPPDLIISRNFMPHLDGPALFEAVRQREATRDVPFIITSLLVDIKERVERQVSRMEGLYFIVIPFDVDDLVYQIERALADQNRP
jgi:CheY-like chemotaxis protein